MYLRSLFFAFIVLCSACHAEQLAPNQFQILEHNIQSKLAESREQLKVMEAQLTLLQQTSAKEREAYQARLMSFQSTWNDTLVKFNSCYKDMEHYKNMSAQEATKNRILTRILIVCILLILIPIILKIAIRFLELKGFMFPATLKFWL
ncbi:MAG: hypothetical protein J6V57_04815 [Spirochaetaceae bacterium]|nr:hypothetical protein [Spirochaetaceae bacterium]